MRRSSLTPADRRHFAAILFIGAAVFLLIALLFFRAGAIDSKKTDPAPSKAPFRDKDGLFTREHYVLVFRGSDVAIWNVLAKFAQQLQPFVVVTKLDILNAARPAVLPPRGAEADIASQPGPSMAVVEGFRAFGAPAPAAKEPDAPLPRELRVVAGDTLPLARIEVDIYRFADDTATAAAESAEEPS